MVYLEKIHEFSLHSTYHMEDRRIRALSEVEGLFQYGAIGRAISYRRSAISSQLSAVSYRRSAISSQLSALQYNLISHLV